MKLKDYTFVLCYTTLFVVTSFIPLFSESIAHLILYFLPQAQYNTFIFDTVLYSTLAAIMFALYYQEIYTSLDYFKTKSLKKIFSIPLWVMLNWLATITIYHAIGNNHIPQNEVSIQEAVATTPLLWSILIIGILGPMVEEIVFRHILIGQLSKSLSTILTVILSIICFMGIHIIGRDQFIISEAITYLPLALITTFVYLKSNKNILYPMAIHMCSNTIIHILKYIIPTI